MRTELKNNWFTFRWLLLVNAILICAIILLHATANRSEKSGGDCEKSVKHFSVDAINSVTVKLM